MIIKRSVWRALSPFLSQVLLCLLCLIFIMVPSSISQAEDTPVTLKGVTLKQLSAYRRPKVTDAIALQEQIQRTLSGLEALTHMSKMVGEPHARDALIAQISSLKANLHTLSKTLKESPSIDYMPPPPPPPPVAVASKSPQVQPPSPMSSSKLSQYWSQLETAPFRDEKMMIIRAVAREAHLKVSQAELLIEGLTFSKDRRDAIIALYPKLIDPESISELFSLLAQPAHRRRVREELNRINMSRRQKR